MLSASEAPARKTNVGAQGWETQRVRKSATGSGLLSIRTESVMRRPALKAWLEWSSVMSTITTPRSQSMATSRPSFATAPAFSMP